MVSCRLSWCKIIENPPRECWDILWRTSRIILITCFSCQTRVVDPIIEILQQIWILVSCRFYWCKNMANPARECRDILWRTWSQFLNVFYLGQQRVDDSIIEILWKILILVICWFCWCKNMTNPPREYRDIVCKTKW